FGDDDETRDGDGIAIDYETRDRDEIHEAPYVDEQEIDSLKKNKLEDTFYEEQWRPGPPGYVGEDNT
ncbi:hypothetical protein Tco_1046829, partial [Tanacetum coccineum]